jgi:polysaccharide biosynthesis protein PelG
MAGIGFELRKLARRDDLFGIVESHAHSALASAGPWLFTILSLGGLVMFGSELVSLDALNNFRLIVIYNFAFSLVLSGPIVMVATRYLADSLYAKDVSQAPAMLLSGMAIVFVASAPVVIPFYLFYANLSTGARLAAIANFFIVSGIWVACLFLTALKDYNKISLAFAIGMASALLGALVLSPSWGLAGMLTGFTCGLTLLLASLIGRILAEYPHAVDRLFDFRPYLRRYWDLALSGLLYNLAIWIDKIVMWMSSQRVEHTSGLISYPDYDSAMFLAYLTIVPSMASFVLSVETDFFEKYLKYYRDIQRHASYESICANRVLLTRAITQGARRFIVLQAAISVTSILAAPSLFAAFHINYTQLGMFRIGVLGAFFQVLFLSMTIVLSYFDMRRMTLAIQCSFLAANLLFSWVTLYLGMPWYGYGYFMACLTVFVITFLCLARVLDRLPYQTFILSNPSVAPKR